jgi:WD40 repeat protein
MIRSVLALLCLASSAFAQARVDQHGDLLPEGAIARFGTVRFRTAQSLPDLYSPCDLSVDGKTLAVETAGGITLWDVGTGRPGGTFRSSRRRDPTAGLRFSPDGKTLARACLAEVLILDAATGRARKKWALPNNAEGLFFFAGTNRFAVIHHDGRSISTFDATDGSEISTFASDKAVYGLSTSGRFFLGISDFTPHLVDAKTGKVHCRFPVEGRGMYSSFVLTPDNRKLCELSREGRFRVFDADTAEVIEDIASAWKDRNAGLGQVFLSPDGAVAYLMANEQETLRRDLKAKKWLPSLPKMSGGRLIPHPDGRCVLLLDRDGMLRRYDLATLLEIPPPYGFECYAAAIPSPDGRRVGITSSDQTGSKLEMFDQTGQYVWSMRPDRFLNFAWSPDSKRLACNGWEIITLRDSTVGKPTATLPLPDGASADQAIFTGEGHQLFVGIHNGGLACYDLRAGKRTGLYDAPHREGFDVSTDGKVLLSFYDRLGISLFDPSTGRNPVDWMDSQWVPNNYSPPKALYSPDGSFVLSWDFEGRTYQRDPQTLVVTRKFRTVRNNPEFHTAISPNALWLAIGSDDGSLSLWDISSGKQLGRWEGHLAAITRVSFAGVGRVVSSSADLTALLWDLRPKKKPTKPLWDALSGDDALEAYRAIWAIADDPKGPDLLGAKVAPAKPAMVQHIKQWLADLGADKYPVREGATKELETLGRLIEPDLRAVRAKVTNEEVRMRLDALLAKIPRERSGNEIVSARAVAAMELSGSEAARKLLGEWAAGAPGARLTIDAKAALARLSPPK